MKLVIANKNYSSWSFRPWILLKAFGIPFEEILVPFGPTFDDPAWKATVGAYTPAGRVPALVDGDVTVFESLAIIEYVAEIRPDLAIWPRDRVARALARSIANEMHAGFRGLRGACPMNMAKRYAPKERGPAVAADVARIAALWSDARARYGAGGAFLFGAFGAADAMYAPVVSRMRSYGFALDPIGSAYIEAMHAHPAFQEWRGAALAEPWIVADDEVDEPAIEDLRAGRAAP